MGESDKKNRDLLLQKDPQLALIAKVMVVKGLIEIEFNVKKATDSCYSLFLLCSGCSVHMVKRKQKNNVHLCGKCSHRKIKEAADLKRGNNKDRTSESSKTPFQFLMKEEMIERYTSII